MTELARELGPFLEELNELVILPNTPVTDCHSLSPLPLDTSINLVLNVVLDERFNLEERTTEEERREELVEGNREECQHSSSTEETTLAGILMIKEK